MLICILYSTCTHHIRSYFVSYNKLKRCGYNLTNILSHLISTNERSSTVTVKSDHSDSIHCLILPTVTVITAINQTSMDAKSNTELGLRNIATSKVKVSRSSKDFSGSVSTVREEEMY